MGEFIQKYRKQIIWAAIALAVLIMFFLLFDVGGALFGYQIMFALILAGIFGGGFFALIFIRRNY